MERRPQSKHPDPTRRPMGPPPPSHPHRARNAPAAGRNRTGGDRPPRCCRPCDADSLSLANTDDSRSRFRFNRVPLCGIGSIRGAMRPIWDNATPMRQCLGRPRRHRQAHLAGSSQSRRRGPHRQGISRPWPRPVAVRGRATRRVMVSQIRQQRHVTGNETPLRHSRASTAPPSPRSLGWLMPKLTKRAPPSGISRPWPMLAAVRGRPT